MSQFLLVCLGGAVGTAARYLLSLGLPMLLGKAFPYATLTVNVVGSFLIGLLMYLGLNTDWLSPMMRVTLTTGIMGGLTTYSTFNYESLEYFRMGAWALGALNMGLTVFLCLLAGSAGLASGQWLAANFKA